jgi:cytochrome c1
VTPALARRAWPAAVVLAALVASCGLGGEQVAPRAASVRGGDAQLVKDIIGRFGCGACHIIPGVKGAHGLVGPPLNHFGRRSFIAGQLANNEANLTRWVMDPQGVEPGTAMPDLDISEDEARNITAYLEGLE